MSSEIMVSISCITYNHEKYIAQAIEGFLMQKTDFAFEILIHDDASTDRTQAIIKEYEARFPDILKPIYQTENQHSKGMGVGRFNRERVKGKYIALCEGDDYWVDPLKLQKQVDYMENHPKCTLCFTNGIVIEDGKPKKKKVIPWLDENREYYFRKNRIYNPGEIQLLGYIPTASLIYPAFLNKKRPEFMSTAIVGDNALKLFATANGYAYFIDEPTCVYRFKVPDSATTKWKESSKEETIKRIDGFIKLIDDFDKYTNYRYEDNFKLAKLTWEVSKLRLLGDYKAIKDKRFKSYFRLLSLKNRFKYHLICYFPKSFSLLKDVREFIRNNLSLVRK